MPTHAEKRYLPHSSQEMFDLVYDVEKYSEFLPWCIGTRIREQNDEQLVADMVIGYKLFREKFTSRVQKSAPNRIDVVYEDGPFKYLNNRWIFNNELDNTCSVDFFVDFEFRSKLLQKMIGVVFNEAVKIMVYSFEKRARVIYKSQD
jgi:coenzyme Q-binding protein COQ10|tara:strand:+ start:467 stop:907 length:441 start_codon:yes stop_codon:yes gene_type:complete